MLAATDAVIAAKVWQGENGSCWLLAAIQKCTRRILGCSNEEAIRAPTAGGFATLFWRVEQDKACSAEADDAVEEANQVYYTRPGST